jgi:gluconolactonase
MYRIILATALAACFLGCGEQVKEAATPEGIRLEVENYGKQPAIVSHHLATVVAKGFIWSEGPVWVEKTKTLLVSDLPGNIIYQWSKEKGQQVYLRNAGFSDTLDHRGGDASNGLAVDRNNQLIICQSGARRIVRMNAPIDAPVAAYEVLADNYQGKKLNSPNDLVVDRFNGIYFTDPVYGLPAEDKDPGRELNFEGVYRISPDGKLALLIDSISRPNGITLSTDEKTLYISSGDEAKPYWYAYRLSDSGTIVSGGFMMDAQPMREKATIKQGPGGLKVDNANHIYSSGPEGISILSPAGELLALIKVRDRFTSNCVFNATKDTLYITADDIILQLPVKMVLQKDP